MPPMLAQKALVMGDSSQDFNYSKAVCYASVASPSDMHWEAYIASKRRD